jgi:hypothetical protein
MARLSAEITDAHPSHELLFATRSASDGVDFTIYQLLQQTGFKMSNYAIGHAAAHPIGNSSSHNLYF